MLSASKQNSKNMMLLVFHRKFGSSVELRFGASSLFRIPLPRQHSVRNSELHVMAPLAVYFYCLPLRLQFSIWGLLIDLSECMRALPKEYWRLHVQKWFANVTHRVVHNEYYRLLNACKHMRYHAVDRHQMNRLLRAMRYSSSQITAIDNVAYEFFTGHQPSERQWRQVLAPSFWPPRFSL